MNRITMDNLTGALRRINDITKSPAEPYTKDKTGKYVANIGNYHLDGAYGGWALHRMHNSGGGVTDVLKIGHVSKRELYTAMQAYISGLVDA